MKLLRRNFLRMTASAVALPALPSLASALDYPTRPSHVVVGFPAGTTVDIVARLAPDSLSNVFGLGQVLREEITIKGGHVQQSNFVDYEPLRIEETPEIKVELIPSDSPPIGGGRERSRL